MIKDSQKLKELFLSLGYNEEDYKKIINNYSLENYKEETLYSKVLSVYNYLISLNYTKDEVIKMTKTLPTIYGYSIENMKQKIEDLIELGYTKEEVIKMTKTLPTILTDSFSCRPTSCVSNSPTAKCTTFHRASGSSL